MIYFIKIEYEAGPVQFTVTGDLDETRKAGARHFGPIARDQVERFRTRRAANLRRRSEVEAFKLSRTGKNSPDGNSQTGKVAQRKMFHVEH